MMNWKKLLINNNKYRPFSNAIALVVLNLILLLQKNFNRSLIKVKLGVMLIQRTPVCKSETEKLIKESKLKKKTPGWDLFNGKVAKELPAKAVWFSNYITE